MTINDNSEIYTVEIYLLHAAALKKDDFYESVNIYQTDRRAEICRKELSKSLF